MKYKPYLLFLSLLPLLSLLALPSPAHAADFSVSITPPIMEARIKPGNTIYYTFNIQNHSSQPLDLETAIEPFQPQGNQGHLQLTRDPQKDARQFFSLLNAHLSLNQAFRLDAGEKRQLVLRIAIPANQVSQDYYQILLIRQTDSSPSQQANLTQARGGIGAPILLSVASSLEPERSAAVVEFQPHPALWGRLVDSFSPLNIDLIIKNTSSSFFKPIGTVTFTKKIGPREKQIKELSLRPDNILAGHQRQISCQTTPCQIDSPFLFGQYFVTLNFRLGNAGPQYQSRLTVWVFPYKLFGLLCLIFLLAFSAKKALDKKN